MPQPQDPSAMRASDADRDRTIDVLKRALAEGRLRPEEYEDRLDAALTARTYGELNRLVTDLPASPTPATQERAPARAGGPAPASPAEDVNKLAIGAFVSGMLVFIGVPGILPIILGALARRQIRETGERGAGFALTGVILGFAQVAIVVLVLVSMFLVWTISGAPASSTP